MTACMVIPTYWTTGEDDSWTVFDHPARIDESGTLRRTLENLEAVDLQMPVVLCPAPTDERIERRVEELAQGLALDVRVFTAADLQRVRETLQSAGAPEEFVSALHKGLQYYFVKDFWVRHLPPKRKKAYWTRHRQDIIRFKYLREKARAYGFKPEQMGLFNGTFIRDDLEYRAVSSSVDAARQFVDRDREEFDAFLESAVLAVALPVSDLLRKVELSLEFQRQWAERLPGIEGAWA